MKTNIETVPYQQCATCCGLGFSIIRILLEGGKREPYKRSCEFCNGFGILIRDPRRDTKKGLAFRKMAWNT